MSLHRPFPIALSPSQSESRLRLWLTGSCSISLTRPLLLIDTCVSRCRNSYLPHDNPGSENVKPLPASTAAACDGAMPL